MKLAVLFAVAALGFAAISGCDGPHVTFGPAIQGDGVIVQETRMMEEFDELELSGAIHARFQTGPDYVVTIQADDNLLPFLSTTIANRRLKIRWDVNGSVQPTKPVSISVTAPALGEVKVSGASRATCRDLATQSFEVEGSGASTIELEGTAGELEVNLSGASRLDGSEFVAGKVELDVSGASSVKIVASESIEGDASGASSVRYGGSAKHIEVDTSGASSVKRDKSVDERKREL